METSSAVPASRRQILRTSETTNWPLHARLPASGVETPRAFDSKLSLFHSLPASEMPQDRGLSDKEQRQDDHHIKVLPKSPTLKNQTHRNGTLSKRHFGKMQTTVA